VFFGLDKSKRALLDAQSAIVCEGQLDLIACYMAGVHNIVAPQGTALTADHARILKRYVEEVVLCFDSDNAGQNATVRSLDSLLASGLAIRVAVMPAPHDPDSLIKESGAAAFQAVIEQAQGFFDYYLARLCATNDLATDKGRLAVLEAMAEAVHKTGNVVLVDTYAQKTALRLGVAPEAVRSEFRKAARSKRSAPAGAEEAEAGEGIGEATEAPRPNTPEFWLLKLLLLHEDTVGVLQAQLDVQWVQHPSVREIISLRLAAEAAGSWQGVAALLTECRTDEMRRLVTEAATQERPIPNPGQQLGDIVLRLRNQFIDRQLAELTQRASQPETAETERLDLMRQREELRQMKYRPLAAPEGSADEPF
jgi:DNA primase